MPILGLILIVLVDLAAIGFVVFELYVVVISDIKGAPFVPSEKKRVDTMLSLAELKPGEKIVDLGSGNGKIVFAAARAGCHATGVEINPFLIWYSKWKMKQLGLARNTQFLKTDFRNYDLKDADVVFVYLLPKALQKLEPKFATELKPGARIISNAFPLKNRIPTKEENRVFLYKV